MIQLERFSYFARLARCRTSSTEAIHGEGKETEAQKIGPEPAPNETQCWRHRRGSHRDFCGCTRGSRYGFGAIISHLYRGSSCVGGLGCSNAAWIRSPWSRPVFIGFPCSRSWKLGGLKSIWSMLNTCIMCRVASPTCWIVSGFSTCIRWVCSKRRFVPSTLYVKFVL